MEKIDKDRQEKEMYRRFIKLIDGALDLETLSKINNQVKKTMKNKLEKFRLLERVYSRRVKLLTKLLALINSRLKRKQDRKQLLAQKQKLTLEIKKNKEAQLKMKGYANAEIRRQRVERIRRDLISKKKNVVPFKPREVGKPHQISGIEFREFEMGGVTTLKDFYQNVRQVQKKFNSAVVVFLIDSSKMSPQLHRTLSKVQMASYSNFSSTIDKFFSKENRPQHGSEGVGASYILDFDRFVLIRPALHGNGGKSKSMFFTFHDQPKSRSKKNPTKPCFQFAMQAINPAFCPEASQKYENYALADAQELCQQHDIRIVTSDDVASWIERFDVADEDTFIGNKDFKKCKITYKQILINQIYYDIEKQHYALIKSQQETFLMNWLGHLFDAEGKKKVLDKQDFSDFLHKVGNVYFGNKKAKLNNIKVNHVMLFWDVETVFNPQKFGQLEPYSIQFMFDLDLYPTENNLDPELKKLNKVVFYYNDFERGIDELLRIIKENGSNAVFVFIAYNGSRFDNFFLLNKVLDKGCLFTDAFLLKNQILNITIDKRHCTFDPVRILNCSLQRAGESFGLRTCKMKLGEEVSMQEIQNHFTLKGELNSFFHEPHCQLKSYDFKFNSFIQDISICIPCKCPKFAQFVKYAIVDVVTLSELYSVIAPIIEKSIKESRKESKKPAFLFRYKTIGSIAYENMCQVLIKRNFRFPLLELDDYKKTRNGLVAGRTQCYRGIWLDLKGTNRYYVLDVKSLYPYVMLNRWYPCGEIVQGNYQTCKQNNLIGFYQVKFNQKQLQKNILPLRQPDQPLDWNYKGSQSIFMNTVDLQSLIDNGCEIEDIGEGYYFTDKIHGSQLFECSLYWKTVKDQQDELKASKSSQYNPALREMAKLFLNSLSGKVIENLHTTKYKISRCPKETANVLALDGTPKILSKNDKFIILEYNVDEKKCFDRDNRPIYFGCLIYSYARQHMYETILRDFDVIYQDCDSAFLEQTEYLRFCQERPHLIGQEFGQFEVEEGSGSINKLVTLAPKNYFAFVDDKLKKKGFKGIKLEGNSQFGCDRLLFKSDLMRLGFTFDILGEISAPKGLDENSVIYMMQELWNAYYNRQLSDLSVLKEFIKQQKNGEPSYILCSSLQKMIRDCRSKTGVNIYQRYVIKTVRC